MGSDTVVKKVVDYIEGHLDEDLCLDRIARELNYSKFYLARIFSEKTGSTVSKYIRGRRLTLAAQELVGSERPIIEIAYETGYESQQAFTYAFQRLYLCTPQAYRKNGIFQPRQTRFEMRGLIMRVAGEWRGRAA